MASLSQCNLFRPFLSREESNFPTFSTAFYAKKQACGPEARALRGKSIGSFILDFLGFLF